MYLPRDKYYYINIIKKNLLNRIRYGIICVTSVYRIKRRANKLAKRTSRLDILNERGRYNCSYAINKAWKNSGYNGIGIHDTCDTGMRPSS